MYFLGVKAAFKPMKILRQCIVRLNTTTPEKNRKGVVYEIQEGMRQMLHRWDQKDSKGQAWGAQTGSKEGRPQERYHCSHPCQMKPLTGMAKVRSNVPGYWQSAATEAILIKKGGETMNLDSGLLSLGPLGSYQQCGTLSSIHLELVFIFHTAS